MMRTKADTRTEEQKAADMDAFIQKQKEIAAAHQAQTDAFLARLAAEGRGPLAAKK